MAQTSVKSDAESRTRIESCLKNSGKKGEWLPGFLVNTIIDPKQETDNMEVLALLPSLAVSALFAFGEHIKSHMARCFPDQRH